MKLRIETGVSLSFGAVMFTESNAPKRVIWSSIEGAWILWSAVAGRVRRAGS